jgi:hypothetical protein
MFSRSASRTFGDHLLGLRGDAAEHFSGLGKPISMSTSASSP